MLIATGFVSPEVEAEMAQGKLCGVIVKPYQLDDVLEKISQAIHQTTENRPSSQPLQGGQ